MKTHEELIPMQIPDGWKCVGYRIPIEGETLLNGFNEVMKAGFDYSEHMFPILVRDLSPIDEFRELINDDGYDTWLATDEEGCQDVEWMGEVKIELSNKPVNLYNIYRRKKESPRCRVKKK